MLKTQNPVAPKEIVRIITVSEFSNLEGRLLTHADASFPDQQQREAVKDLVRQTLWNWFDKKEVAYLDDGDEIIKKFRKSREEDRLLKD